MERPLSCIFLHKTSGTHLKVCPELWDRALNLTCKLLMLAPYLSCMRIRYQLLMFKAKAVYMWTATLFSTILGKGTLGNFQDGRCEIPVKTKNEAMLLPCLVNFLVNVYVLL